jgi:selenide,water dikinase
VRREQGLPQHEIVLLGAGHTNAHIVRMWRMAPIPNARLTVVSNFYLATYSGMLPGTLAGLYPRERMQIDLVRLCAASGVRLLKASVVGLDRERQELLCEDRPPIPFDVLSIGIGSVPRGLAEVARASDIVPIKPMQTFLPRLDKALRQAASRASGRPLRVAVVGAGAGGVEIAFCLPRRVREVLNSEAPSSVGSTIVRSKELQLLGGGSDATPSNGGSQGTEVPYYKQEGAPAFELTLVDAASRILPTMPEKTAAAARAELDRRGVRLLLGQGVREIADATLVLDDGSRHPVDLVLWATGAQPPELLSHLGLPTDDRGFLLTDRTLRTIAGLPIFVVGDSGAIQDAPTPKAGVYAVRQGPFLWANLHRQLAGQPLLEYEPQPGFLSALATGDGRAILSYKGMTFHGRWCWRLKDYIDGRFMDKYQDYSPMPMTWPTGEANSVGPAMRCAGCGGKVGGSVLSRVLERLDIPPSEHVLVGLEAPDDAAVLRPTNGRPIVATVDFFAPFLDDPYLVGRVAALNAASDLFAKGARPIAALAMATIPLGSQRQQEQLLYELLAGSLHELRPMGATLVGGHTLEGPQTTIGFSMLAEALGPPRVKGNLRPGDLLVLTKPVGSGVLLAAHQQARCRAEWLESLLPVLLASNQPAASLADEFEIAAITDITGFGLAGHLAEMLRASGVAAQLDLKSVPLLPGVAELIGEGVESTLAPANRAVEAHISIDEAPRRLPHYTALFDPQTSGGLLLGVSERHVENLLRRLGDQGAAANAIIGQAVPKQDDGPFLTVR